MTEGDVYLQNDNDGGEITVINGEMLMTGGLEDAVFLSLYGGNIKDTGEENSSFTWWGNLLDNNEKDDKYISRTQYLLNNIAATPANLLRLDEAVNADLAWMLERKIVSSIEVESTIPDYNKINIKITIEANGKEETFEFTDNWKAQKLEAV